VTRGARVGIDLGTTHSLVSVMDGTRPIVLPNGLGETLTPSAVSVTEDGSLLVGAAARARAVTHPESTVLAFKRDMGTDRVFRLGGREFGPEELSALVLAELRRDAEQALGQPIVEAVVTVPAYFGELQRRATRAACDIAGLHVERIINEPTAAALAYGLHQRSREFRAAILDLGGGTFDVTLLELMEGVIEIRSTAGDLRLGGDDFTDLLADLLVKKLDEQHGLRVGDSRVARARVREAAELAKKRLAGAAETRVPFVDLPLAGGRVASAEVSLSRDEAESVWIDPLLRMRAPVERAMRDAELPPAAIDEVLLVGGATRMPCVRRLAAQLFGRLPLTSLPPDHAIAMGAAVQVELKAGSSAVEELVVTDVAPFSLGVETVFESSGRHISGLFTPVLDRGTVLPASRVKTFRTAADGQHTISVQVYQGEHSLCRDNVRLGAYQVEGIPRKAAGEEAVDIRFTYDLNGLLDIDVTVHSTGQETSFTLEPTAGKLTPEQIAIARQRLKAVKLHPREALPNVTALARAEALYVTLSGFERERVALAMNVFRTALERQDPEPIRRARESLNALVRSAS